jgi:hypothetical protein
MSRERNMPKFIRFVAFINRVDATGDHQGGTGIQVVVPDGLEEHEEIAFITGRVAGEVSRYLASECLSALRS